MLKTTSKAAIENIKKYIMENFGGTNHGIETPETFKETAKIIIDTFKSEKYREYGNRQDLFIDWCEGLPSILDTCYYYNRSAVDDLGAILEETEEEKTRYTEEQACRTLTCLIYRELNKATR